jgi:hypothetical protein
MVVQALPEVFGRLDVAQQLVSLITGVPVMHADRGRA